jgi:hypothetical protein
MEPSARHRASLTLCALAILAVVAAAPHAGIANEGEDAAGSKTVSAPEAWPEVTSKRLRPPTAGTGKRITVQLTEIPDFRERRGPMTIPPGPGGAWTDDQGPRLPGVFDWYWAAVSPSLEQSGPARVARAIDTVARPPADAPSLTPRLQSLQKIADLHGVEILSATVGTRVSPALVLAMIAVESAGRPEAISSAGAVGLMQLMPATADRFGVADRTRPDQNIRGGVAYMDWLLQEFQGDAVMALAGYNAGENAVKSHGGVPPYAETRAYVPKVLAAWTVARGLCLTPPQLLSDPCVFVGRRTASSD